MVGGREDGEREEERKREREIIKFCLPSNILFIFSQRQTEGSERRTGGGGRVTYLSSFQVSLGDHHPILEHGNGLPGCLHHTQYTCQHLG